MNRVKISDERRERGERHALQLKAAAKMKAYNDAIEIVEPFTPVKTKQQREEFYNDMIGFVVRGLRVKFKDFESMMTDERLLEFVSCPTHIIRECQNRVKADPQLKFNSEFTAIDLPSVEVFASTPEEIKRLEASQRLIDAVNELRSLGYSVYATQLAQAVSFAVSSNGKELKHNPQFIKRKR